MAHSAEPPPSGGDFIPTDHVGVLLQEARLRAGLDLRLVAEDLRIRYHHLLAIEKGRFGDLPGPTYVSGFIRAYAEHLGLDAEGIVHRHKAEAGSDAASPRRLEFPVPARDSSVSAGLFLAVALLVVGAGFGGWFWMSSRDISLGVMVAGLQDRAVAFVSGVWTSGQGEDDPAPASETPDLSDGPDAPVASGQEPSGMASAGEPDPDADGAGEQAPGPGAGDDPVPAVASETAEEPSPDPLIAALDGGGAAGSDANEQAPGDDTAAQSGDGSGRARDASGAADPAPVQGPAEDDTPTQIDQGGTTVPVPQQPPEESAGGDTATSEEDPSEAVASEAPEPESNTPGADDQATEVEGADASTSDSTTTSGDVSTGSVEDSVSTGEAPPGAVPAVPEATAEDTPPPDVAEATDTAREMGPAASDEATAPGLGAPETTDAAGDAVPEVPTSEPVSDAEGDAPDADQAEAEAEPDAETPPAYVGRPAPAPVRQAGGGGRIVLRANQDAWIQVRRGGDLIVRRLLRRGDTYAVPEGAGYTLNTTNAGGLEVYVDDRRAPNLGPVGASRTGVRLSPGSLN